MGELLKITKEVAYYTEDEAKAAIETAVESAKQNNYTIGAAGYKYKNKKSKGEIIEEKWVVTITEVHGELWI